MVRRHLSDPRDASPLAVAALVLALAFVPAASAAGQGGSHSLRGVTRDSSTNAVLAGALVDLRSASLRRTARTDEEGNFRIVGVASGRYQVSVHRIGFREWRGDIVLADRDTAVVFSLVPVARALDAFRVRGDISAIYGMVGTLPDLLPLKDARVQVLGANKSVTTDSSGGFFIPVANAGQYMVRITRPGYAERLFSVDVPRNRAIEASRLLDPTERDAPKGLDVVYVDMDQRLRMKATASAALVPGAEIRRAGTNLVDAIQASPSFGARGVRIGKTACIFLNGIARPGLSMEGIRVEEIEAVEVYAGKSDRSQTLSKSWPSGAPCGINFGTFTRSQSTDHIVQYVVVWLRK